MAPSVRTGGSRHTGQAASPHWNIQKRKKFFYCGNDKEYKYFTGVYVWLYDENDYEWIYRVRSQIYATGYDLKKMNDTIRCLKKYCEASFKSDEGTNRYFKEGILIKGAESGCYFAAERLFNNFSLLRQALDKFPSDTEGDKHIHKISGLPTPNMLNANVYSTYLCSLIEEYFRSTYIALLKYSERKEKVLNAKFSSFDMMQISSGEKTVEEVYAGTLSFQNIYKICSNFNNLDKIIQINQPLMQPYNNRKKSLFEQINEILERRHGLIHRLEIDDTYCSEDLERDIKDIIVAIKRVYSHLCAIYNWDEQELSL